MTDRTQRLQRLIGSGPRMQAVRELLMLNAGDMTPVAVVGEPGTGRQLIARILRDLSPPPAGSVARPIAIYDPDHVTPPGWLLIALPPLRSRIEDLPALTERFFSAALTAPGETQKRIAPSAWQALHGHSWPGNLRELQQLCEWLRRTCACSSVKRGCLPSRFEQVPVRALTQPAPPRRGLDAQLRALEESLINQALHDSGFNRSRAARLLDIKRSTLGDRIERLGMTQKWAEDVA